MLALDPCVVWVAGAGVDYASTQYALSRGAVEMNPLQSSPAGRIGVQAAYATVGCVMDARLRKGGHRKLARGLRTGLFIFKLALAVHNVRSVR